MCCDSPSPPPPPDYAAMSAANKEAAEVQVAFGREQLAWAKERDLYNQGIQEQIRLYSQQLMDEQRDIARQDRARTLDVFRPVEDRLISEAEQYDTPERRMMEAGRASTAVAQQFGNQRQALEMQLAASGVNPNSSRFAGTFANLGINQAAAQAGAATNAARNVENTGRAMRADVVNLGRGLPSTVAQSYGQTLQAGQGQQANLNQAFGAASGAMTAPVAWFQAGNQALGNWGNAINQGYQAQLGAYNAANAADAQNSAGMGQFAGTALTAAATFF